MSFPPPDARSCSKSLSVPDPCLLKHPVRLASALFRHRKGQRGDRIGSVGQYQWQIFQNPDQEWGGFPGEKKHISNTKIILMLSVMSCASNIDVLVAILVIFWVLIIRKRLRILTKNTKRKKGKFTLGNTLPLKRLKLWKVKKMWK